jgi:FtsP/CotA-like multicopper oxidase with cupredoxin domain
MFFLELAADPPSVDEPVPATSRDIAPVDVSSAVRRTIDLTMGSVDDKLVLGINGVPSWQAEPLHAQVGDTELWTVTNEMDWDHPFHLHGFFFQPVDAASGLPPARPEWKDTINVPRQQTVAFAVRYDDRPGMWMFHCHILDHADAGMMGMVHLAR